MKRFLKRIIALTAVVAGIGTLASCDKKDEYSHDTVTIYFGGSTSVEKIAKALTESFANECKYFVANHNHTGSSDAYKFTQGSEKNAVGKLDVGFLSRELKTSEAAANGTSGLICKDGIVAIVNNANTSITNVTKEQLKTIYSSSSITWADITGVESETSTISRYTRDSSSGTRDGFFTAIDYSDAKTDDSKLPGASITTGNGDMITKVKNDPYGIGYISLASLASAGVKGLQYEDVTATEEAVVSGTYQLSRNFNYITRTEADCSDAEWDVLEAFMLYMTSSEALTIIASHDGILTTSISSAKSWDTIKSENPDVAKLCA